MYIHGICIDLMRLCVSIHIATHLALRGEHLKYLFFNETSLTESMINSPFSKNILYFLFFSRTMFSIKRPYIRLLWPYFPCFGISALSTIIFMLCKYILYFLRRSLVINVNSICGDRFLTSAMTLLNVTTIFKSR